MAWESLISAVEAVITANGNNEITGTILKDLIVNNLIPQLGSAKFKGVASLNTSPGTPENDVFYLATQSGTYTNFSNLEVEKDGLTVLQYSTTASAWSKNELDLVNFKNAIKPLLKNRVINGALDSSFSENWTTPGTLVTIPNPPQHFTDKSCLRGYQNPTNYEFYLQPKSGQPFVLPNSGQYFRWSCFLYVPAGDYPPTPDRMRGFIFRDGGAGTYLIPTASIVQLSTGVYQVQGVGKLDFSENITNFWLEIVWESADRPPSNGNVYVSGVQIAYSNTNELFNVSEDFTKSLEQNVVQNTADITSLKTLPVNSIVVGGNFATEVTKDFSLVYGSLDVVENMNVDYLAKIGCVNGGKILRKTSGNYECYIKPNDVAAFTNGQSGKYFNFRYYAYCSVENELPDADRVRLLWTDSSGTTIVNSTTDQINIKRLTNNIIEVSGSVLWTLTGTLTEFRLAIVWESRPELPSGTDIYVTGYSAIWVDAIDVNRQLRDNWSLTTLDPRVQANEDSLAVFGNAWNNKFYNLSAISNFLKKYEMRDIDDFNQLSITMVGDSIFGRQSLTEMAITQDTNGGTGNGYTSGHFPPNMWNENVAFKLLELLQFPHSDVKYFNHNASEVTKSGTISWVDNFPLGADQLRVSSSVSNDAEITFSKPVGHTFIKYIYSTYSSLGSVKGKRVKITVSTDGGTTFVTPASLSLTESYTNDGVSGEYTLPNHDYKFGNIMLGGFNETRSYIIKVARIPNSDSGQPISCWGFESWKNKRVNIIVTAEGGNVAGNQLSRWERFYSKMYNPSLIIYELPYLNDLGTGTITQFKGTATTTTTPSGSPSTNDFWYASETGTYTNFGNLEAKLGDYIEYNGSIWVVGRSEVDSDIQTYHNNNKAVFDRCKTLGTDILTLITHDGTSGYPGRPFMYQIGLTVLRNLVSKNGFASIDVNKYQKDNNLTSSIVADGTHLSDTGVQMYVDLMAELLNIGYSGRAVAANSVKIPSKLFGSSSGAGVVQFGYEFSKIPKVRIFGNSNINITDIDESSFTVTGTGSFDYEAFVIV